MNYIRHIVVLVLAIMSTALYAQTVSGTVTDDNNQPLPGATIVVQGTNTGTTTDFDGNYQIRATQGQTLVFSYVGYATQNVVVSSATHSVSLQADNTLDEVVVTGSAAGKSIKELSFSVGRVGNELLDNVPAVSAGQALQGKISGLSVSSVGGQPGSDVSIQLRTANSIATGQNPLIILDGVIIEGGLADINTEDIDRIEVAKGAAGASLYGSRAANGVIQIFSKRGKYGYDVGDNVNVTYRSEAGWRNVNAKYDLAKTHKYLMLPDGSNFDLSTGSRQLDPDGFADNPYPAGRTLYDNQDRVFQNVSFNSHFTSVSGGGKNAIYLFSYSRLDDGGIIKEVDSYKRDNFRLNLDSNLSEKLNLKTSLFYANSSRDAGINSGSTINALFATLMAEPIHDMLAANEEDGSPYNYDFDTIDENNRNPLYTLANNDREERRNRVLGNVALDYRVMPWLTLNGSYSYDYENNAFDNYIPKGFLSDSPDGQAQNIGFIQNTTTYFPWKLPTNAQQTVAVLGDNSADNLEHIKIAENLGGTYKIEVSHKGTLSNGSQEASLILSGPPGTIMATAQELENIQKNNFLLAPMPAEAYFNVTAVNNKLPFRRLRLLNLNGSEVKITTKDVFSLSALRFDVPYLAAGLYVLEIETPSGNIFKHVLIR